MITLSHIDYRYDGTDCPVFSNFSFTLNAGEFVMLLGRNGCGKSTLFKLLTRRITPDSGTALLPAADDICFLDQHIHYNLFLELTLKEHLRLARMIFTSRADESDYLASFHPDLPKHMNTKVQCLSGGQKQALVFAVALYRFKHLLLLDEPTSAVDPETGRRLTKRLYDYIKHHQCGVIFCTHNLAYIRPPVTRVGVVRGSNCFRQRQCAVTPALQNLYTT